jgi:serine/threonine protein phosphatase PrpC
VTQHRSADACDKCGAAVSPADNFCEKCGQGLAAGAVSAGSTAVGPCRSCGFSQMTADGYCEQCGHKGPVARDHLEIDLGALAGVTDRGLRHHRNEDAMGLALSQTPNGPAALAVVCDGVSTSPRADEASLTGADTALRVLADRLRAGAAPTEALASAVLAADAEVSGLGGQSANSPAATIVSGVVTAEAIAVGWLGDSRAYWLPSDQDLGSQLLTRDDSLATDLIATGALSEADAIALPDAHVITRWLGADAQVREPHTTSFRPSGPGLLLLCTDGLWNYAPEPDELARLAKSTSPADLHAAASHLLAFALQAGGQDNITVVLLAFPQRGNGIAEPQRSTQT